MLVIARQTEVHQGASTRRKDSSVASAAARDFRLVEKCLAGDVEAWHQLYSEQQPILTDQVHRMLYDGRYPSDVTDEVTSRIWCRLMDDGYRILAGFDLRRDCRLSTYLAALATKEVLRYLRAERRLRSRNQQMALRRNQMHSVLDSDLRTSIDDFLATLSPRERDFCQQYLLSHDVPSPMALTPANQWQLRHRVKTKLKAFLRND